MRLFKVTPTQSVGARVCPALVTKQRGLDQRFRDGSTIDRDKRCTARMGECVQVTRKHFLSGAAFTSNQDGSSPFGNARRLRRQ